MSTKDKMTDEASRHVQRHARYMPDSPSKPYYVRYGSRLFLSNDTWDLVKQLAAYLREQRKESAQ